MKAPRDRCSIPGCWQFATGPSGLCHACKCWWRRIRYKSATEYANYTRRVARTAARIGTVTTHRRG